MEFLNDTLIAFGFNRNKRTTPNNEKQNKTIETPPDIAIEPPSIPQIAVEDIVMNTSDDTMAKMNVTIPKQLKIRFKNKCMKSGTDMSKMVNFWVKQFLSLDTDGAPRHEN